MAIHPASSTIPMMITIILAGRKSIQPYKAGINLIISDCDVQNFKRRISNAINFLQWIKKEYQYFQT